LNSNNYKNGFVNKKGSLEMTNGAIPGEIEVQLIDWWPKEGDKAIAHQAWASTYDLEKLGQKTPADILRVVTQVVDHQHDTPKERVWMDFALSVPIFVERQYDKYRMTVQHQGIEVEWYEAPFGRWGVTQNELSGRYRTIPAKFMQMPKDVSRILQEGQLESNCGLYGAGDFRHYWRTIVAHQYREYQEFLNWIPQEWRQPSHPRNKDYKRVREFVRSILGTAFFTNMRVVCNLNALEHILCQRLAPEAQPEAQETALVMLNQVLIAEVAPTAIAQMIHKHGWKV
jgi:thymidylate synthase ThyX